MFGGGIPAVIVDFNPPKQSSWAGFCVKRYEYGMTRGMISRELSSGVPLRVLHAVIIVADVQQHMLREIKDIDRFPIFFKRLTRSTVGFS